ncbi:MAG: oxidoreductase fad/nad(p)-binding domain protein [Erysipelotrichaceae bacterium]|nr:MAG: oxidoreductase fad/nad(p)-binding domain [Erysipelotrichaceae bacterium]TXT18463.1 MAG: oxidoreductase fad/nad(p)-binding domain protein [Erysipelotrichaceae bacterium]
MAIVSACIVTNIIDINKDVKKFRLKLAKPISYEPGQFLHLTTELVSASDYWPTSRAFSIASYSTNVDDEIEVYIKNNGGYTKEVMESLHIGSMCTVKYPYGDFILPELKPNTKIVGICNGVGITPLLSILDYMSKTNQQDQFYLHYSIRNLEEIIGKEKIEKIASDHLALNVTRQNTKHFNNRRIDSPDFVGNYDPDNTYFFVSGSNQFIQDMQEKLLALGYTKIIVDSWR